MKLTTTPAQQEALRRAWSLLRHQAEGLQETGSKNTVAAIHRYLATLEKVRAGQGEVDLTPEEKIDVQQAAFLLEGVRDSLLNADFRERAQIIQQDIDALEDLIERFNTKAALE